MVRVSGSAVILLLVGVQYNLTGASRCLRDHLHRNSDELEVIVHSERENSSDASGDATNGTIFVQDDSYYSGPLTRTFEQQTPIREIDVALQARENLTAWPAPVIISVSRRNITARDNLAYYEMRWTISPAANLTAFRAVVCTPRCVSNLTAATQFNVILKVSFNIKFNVSIIALYHSPNATKPIERSSKILEYKSGFGPPGPITNIKGRFKNEGRSLKITWDRPSPPNGPINYYDMNVTDILDGKKFLSEQPSTTEVVLDVTGMSGYGVEVALKAVNIDPSSGTRFVGGELKASLNHVKLSKPANVARVSRSQNSITFRLSPPNYRQPFPFIVYFKIESKAHVQNNYATDLVVIDRLVAFEKVTLDVSACYLTATFKQYICGDSRRVSGTSNVAAPSPITKVDILLSANNDTELRWTSPQTPNGPINGFIVSSRETGNPSMEWGIIRNLDRTARGITIGHGELENGKSYEFAVAAYNRDLEQTSQLHYGTLTVATPPALPTSSKAWIIPVVVFSVFVVLAGVGLGAYYYYGRSGKPIPRILTFSKA